MSDLIDRQELIYRIECLPFYHEFWKAEGCEGLWESEDVENCIKNMPSAQQWIPTSERLPVWERWYIVTIDVGNSSYINYKVNTLYMKDGKWHDYAYGGLEEFNMPVIAWMPLPEPYRGGINDE